MGHAVQEKPFVPNVPKGGHWSVPREWIGERCFILCGGSTLKAQRHLVPQLQGRIIAVKQSVLLRPDADVMFVSGKDDPAVCKNLFPKFKGQYLIARSAYVGMPPYTKTLCRTKQAYRLSHDSTHLAGLDGGTSAINLAYLFGATEIVMLGYDMRGGRWFNGELPHHLPFPPQEHFDRHLDAIKGIAKDLTEAGVKVWNCSPKSKVRDFEAAPLERFL